MDKVLTVHSEVTVGSKRLILLKFFLIFSLIFQFILTNITLFSFKINQLINLFFIFAFSLGIIKGIIVNNFKINIIKELKTFIFLILSFMVWQFIALLNSSRRIEDYVDFMRFVLGYLIFFYVILNAIKINFISIINYILVLLNIGSAITLIQVVLFYTFGISSIYDVELVRYFYGGVFRAVGTLGGPVASGTLHFFGIVLASYLWEKNKSKMALSSIMLNMLSMFIMMSRTALLSAIIFLTIIVIKNKMKYKLFFVVLIIFSFSIAVSITGLEYFINRLSDLNLDKPDAGMGRIEIWKANLHGFLYSSLLTKFIGSGINAASKNTFKYSYFSSEDFAHNDYLDILVSGGIYGLIIYVLICINHIYILIKYKKDQLINFLLYMNIIYYLIISNLQPNILNSGHRWLFLIINGICFSKIFSIKQKVTI